MEPQGPPSEMLIINPCKAYRCVKLAWLVSGRLDLTVFVDGCSGDRRRREIPVVAGWRRPGRDRRRGLVPTGYFGFGRGAEGWSQGRDGDLLAKQRSPAVR